MDKKEENKESLLTTFLRSFHSTLSSETTEARGKLLLWNDFLEQMSNMIDQKILSYCKEHKCDYINGNCTFTGTLEGNEFDQVTVLNVDVLLYFTAPQENKALRLPLHTQRFYHDFDLENEETLDALRKVLREQLVIEIAAPDDTPKQKG